MFYLLKYTPHILCYALLEWRMAMVVSFVYLLTYQYFVAAVTGTHVLNSMDLQTLYSIKEAQPNCISVSYVK